MFKIVTKEKGNLEIAVMGHLTTQEFEDIIVEMQFFSKEYESINVLLDFRSLDGYDKIFIDKTRFFDPMKKQIGRVGVVAAGVTAPVFMEYMKTISKDYRRFDAEDLEEARKWVFK